MRIFKKILIICISVFLLAGCDQTSKRIAQDELKNNTMKSYLGGSLQFLYVENSGGMLSFGSELSDETRFIIFQLFVPAMLLLLFAFAILKKDLGRWEIIAFILFLSGGIGNLISRITNEGKVIDFIVIGMFDYHTGIFNIADVYVLVGILFLVISKIFTKKHSLKIVM